MGLSARMHKTVFPASFDNWLQENKKMKCKGYLILLIILIPLLSFASGGVEKKMEQQLGDHDKYKDFFFKLKAAVLEHQKEKVADLIGFPVTVSDGERKFVINNKKEFLFYYDLIFDKALLKTIEQQRFDELFVNWRGVMIGSGEIWYAGICEDANCKKVVVKINSFHNPSFFSSKIALKAAEELFKKEKMKLHASLQTYDEPILQWQTEKYLIRVDRIGEYNYRYAAWYVDSDQRKKPNIILNNGEIIFDGSGGNHYYEFTNGAYKYRCYVTVLGTEESPPGYIEVFKNEKRILHQEVIKVLK